MVSSASFVFFESRSSAVSLAHAGDHLRDAGLQVVDHGGSLEVSDGQGGLAFAVELLAPEQAGALADRLRVPHGRAASLRIGIADIDDALDEINTLIEVQAALQSLAPDAWLFNEWNETLVDQSGTAVDGGTTPG